MKCDLLVMGGGVAGLTAALALAQQRPELSITVVEAGHYQQRNIGETLTPDIRGILEQLGLWQAFLAQQPRPAHGSCAIWTSETLGFNDYLLAGKGPGWHINRCQFEALLAAACRKYGIRLLLDTRMESYTRSTEGFALLLQQDKHSFQIKADFIIDATGVTGSVANGLTPPPVPLDQFAFLYCFCPTPDTGDSMSHIEAQQDGWWYCSHLPAGISVLGLACDPIQAQSYLSSPGRFAQALHHTSHIKAQISGISALQTDQQLAQRSVGVFCRDALVGENWACVGNTAWAMDPICAQGLQGAMQDALALGGQLAKGLKTAQLGACLAQYATHARQSFEHLLSLRNTLYAQQTRFTNASFWQARRDASQAQI